MLAPLSICKTRNGTKEQLARAPVFYQAGKLDPNPKSHLRVKDKAPLSAAFSFVAAEDQHRKFSSSFSGPYVLFDGGGEVSLNGDGGYSGRSRSTPFWLHHRDTVWWQITNQTPARTSNTTQVLTDELFYPSPTALCQFNKGSLK